MISFIVTTEGLVLRSFRQGDTSRVATLFTRELGKIAVIAKGVRVPGSPFGASLEVFAHAQYVVYFRRGRDLQMLKTGDLERDGTAVLRNYQRYRAASAVVEFLDRMLLEEEPEPRLLSLALRALRRVERGPVGDLSELVRAFQLRAASLLGYAPRLDGCLHCGASAPEAALLDPSGSGDPWVFRPAEGGVLCPSCGKGEAGHRLTARALLRLRSMALASNPGEGRVEERAPVYLDAPAYVDAPADEEEISESRRRWLRALDSLVEDFLRFHVERYRGLRSLGSR